MKKVIVLLLLTILGVCANAANGHDPNTREEIRIKELYQSEGTVDRSIDVYVDAAIMKDTGQIGIEYSGIRNPTIYLVDAHGQIVEQMTNLSYSSVEYLSAPTYAGVFNLIIWSDNYGAVGTFTVK